MKKEQIQENGISRRGFLKRTALAGRGHLHRAGIGESNGRGKSHYR